MHYFTCLCKECTHNIFERRNLLFCSNKLHNETLCCILMYQFKYFVKRFLQF